MLLALDKAAVLHQNGVKFRGGEVIARMRHLGKRLRVQTQARRRVARTLVDGRAVPGLDLIPKALLRNGSNIEADACE